MTGTGIGFDFSQLMTQFAQLDAELKKLTVSGKNFGDNMKNIFATMTKGDFKNFAAQIKQLRGDVVAFGKVKVGLNWDSTSLQNYINDVNRLILVIKQIREGAKGSHELKGSGISIQGLKKELKDAQELLAIVKKVEQQTKRSSYDRNTSYAGATNYSNNAVSIEQNAKAVEYLTAARNKLKTTDADYLTKLEDLNTRIQKHNEILHRSKQTNKEAADEAKKTAEATKRANDQMLRTPAELVGMKGSAKTMNELKLYAEQLKKTMNTLNPKSAEWQKLNGILQQTERQISRVENKMKGLNGIASVFKNALSGVGRMVATAFAVERIWQFSKSIVSVTGEFEQMKVALGSMVGNLEQTNRLWEQTMELAKESPFQARELVKYTRQLAAYRIETDKLHKTTKMLADVSAGLGVDMSRLILAYGQVRAAEYLRGTELRQFTEAGVPMLEELAKHFSELEGHAVSTAEVFDMISKRQVAFSDVSDVLERMTSEGGPFYKMQEVMSDTIKGSISNLKDEIDLMMYEIGQSNSGVIKGTLNILRSLVRNWEYVGAAIKTATVAVISYTLASKSAALSSLTLKGVWNAITAAIGRATTAMRGFFTSLGPIGLAVTIISTLATAILSYRAARRDANKEDEKAAELAGELKAIDKQYSELTQSIEKYGDAFREASDSGNLSEMEVQLTRLIELAREKYSIVFDVKIEGATEEELKDEFNKVNKTLSEAGIFSKNFQKAFEEKDPYREGGEYSLYTREAEMLDHWEREYTKIKAHVEQLLKSDDTKELFRLYEPGEDVLAYMYEYYSARYKLAKDNGLSLNKDAMDAFNNLSYIRQLREAYVKEIKQMIGGESDWGDNLSLNLGAALTGLLDRDQIDDRATEAWKSTLESVFEVDEISIHVDDGMDEWETEFNKFILERREKTKEAIKKAEIDDEAELGDSFRIGGAVVALLNKDNTKTRQELAKYLKEQRDIQKEILDAIATGAKAYSEVEKAAAEIKYNELDAAITHLAGTTVNKKGKGTDKVLEQLKQKLSMIKEMNQEFEKLTKDMTDEASKAQVKESFLDSAKEIGIDISEEAFDDAGAIAMLQQLLNDKKYQSKKYQTEIKKILDNFLVQDKVEGQKEERENLKSQVESLFDRNELTKQVKDLGLDEETAEKLFGFDSLSLEDLRKQLEGMKDAFYATGEDGEKAYKSYIDKITDMEVKAQRERLKKYVEYLNAGMNDRVKLKIEEMRKLKEIEESKEFSPEQKEQIKKQVSKEAREEQDKQEWEDFKGTEMYTMMFEDLEHYGSAAIDALYKKLSELKTSLSDLPASEVKEIVGQIEKLENIKIERNPFESLKTYKNEVKNIGFSEEELQNMLMGEVNIEKQAQDIIDVINIVQQSIADGGEEAKILQELTPEQLRSWEQAKNIQQQTGETLDGVVKRQERIVKKSKEHQTTIVGQQKAYKKLDKSQEAALKETEVWLNSVGDLFSASKELMESFGVESDSVAMTIADTGSSMVSLILSAVQFTAQLYAMGIAANSALGIIGWVAIAIQAVAMAIAAIFSAKDKALQKQVKDNLSTVEELQKRYDALEDAIDGAWSTTAIQQYNKELQATTQSMIEAQKAAIAAQEQRKGANKEGSEKWQELQDMKEELNEMTAQLEESLEESFSKVTDGILDEVLDAAKDFTDAWYDAFKETGDGLSGLEENFDEMFMNLAKNQAAMQITGKFVEDWKEALKDYINDEDTELTKEDAAAWAAEVRSSFPELNAALEAFLGTISDGLGGKSGNLSELQKGIQGITEDTAQVLESLLNSMRLYVADTNMHIKDQTDYIKKMWKMMDDSINGMNPFYVQMKNV